MELSSNRNLCHTDNCYYGTVLTIIVLVLYNLFKFNTISTFLYSYSIISALISIELVCSVRYDSVKAHQEHHSYCNYCSNVEDAIEYATNVGIQLESDSDSSVVSDVDVDVDRDFDKNNAPLSTCESSNKDQNNLVRIYIQFFDDRMIWSFVFVLFNVFNCLC